MNPYADTPRRYQFKNDSIIKDRWATRLASHETIPACLGPGTRERMLQKNPSKTSLVELIGIEPTTSGLQSPRSPS